MRFVVIRRALPLLALAWGCADAPAVRPAGGAPEVSATAASATLTVVAASWGGSPGDLAEHVTPIAVRLRNDGASDVRVSYLDFQLTDPSGFRYAIINPFRPGAATSQRELPMSREDRTLADARAAEDNASGVTLVAFGHGGVRVAPPVRGHFAPRPYGGPVRVAPRPRPFPPHGIWVGHPRYWRHYAPLPFYRPWFGVRFSYWPGPWLLPPGYATWVWAWSPAYYPAPSPPPDVIASALPEGVLQPGGQVDGFLFFQKVQPGVHVLNLTWDVSDSRSGSALGRAQVALDLIEP